MTTPEEVRELGRRVSNWGRWGPDDELGTLNHITPEARSQAARLVRTGTHFSLALPLDEHGPARPGGTRGNPTHEMTATGDGTVPGLELPLGGRITDDMLHLHLQCTTQWDSLAHVYYDDMLYNGFPASSVTKAGAARAGITASASSFAGRGVLLDVARFRGVKWLGPNDAIDSAELDAVAEAQRVELRPGDIVLIRTGLMRSWHETRTWEVFWQDQPGLDISTATWLFEHDIAALAADNVAVERMGTDFAVPLHMVALRDMGMCFGELWDLEALSEACADNGAYDFLLMAQALPVTGGVGSPVNPIVLK